MQWAGGFERQGGVPTLVQADSSRSSPSSVCLEEAAPRPPSAQELGGRAEGLPLLLSTLRTDGPPPRPSLVLSRYSGHEAAMSFPAVPARTTLSFSPVPPGL